MATDRTANASTFWTSIKDLVDGELVTKALLYTQALHRLQDNAAYLLARFAQVYSDLSSTATGTQANLTGSVDITTFNFDSGIALNGKTLILDEDTTGPQTVTFGVVTNPTQLLQAFIGLTNITASLNQQGRLVFKSGTVGAGSTIFADPAGTAYAALLDTPSSQVGSGNVADGTTRIGAAAVGAIPAGTLRSVLEALESAATGIADKVSKAGDTMTGSLSFTAPAQVVYNVAASRLSRASWRIPDASTGQWLMGSGGAPIQNGGIGTATIEHDLDVVTGDTITEVAVVIQGGSGHVGMPATKPALSLWKWPAADATPTQVGGTVSDPSTTTVDYEAVHEIEVTGVSESVDATTRYFVRITGENGANAITGLQAYHARQDVLSLGLPPGA